MLQIEKEHKRSTLMSRKKKDLVDQIMRLEHNNNVLEDTLNTQAANFIKLTSWILVSERLPEDKEHVIVTDRDGCAEVAYHSAERWHLAFTGYLFVRDPLAWMPLPEPYKPD